MQPGGPLEPSYLIPRALLGNPACWGDRPKVGD